MQSATGHRTAAAATLGQRLLRERRSCQAACVARLERGVHLVARGFDPEAYAASPRTSM